MRERDFGAPQIDREVGEIDISQQKAVLDGARPTSTAVRQAGWSGAASPAARARRRAVAPSGCAAAPEGAARISAALLRVRGAGRRSQPLVRRQCNGTGAVAGNALVAKL